VASGLSRREVDRTIRSAQQQTRQDPHATPQPPTGAGQRPARRRGQRSADRPERDGRRGRRQAAAGQHRPGPVMKADRDASTKPATRRKPPGGCGAVHTQSQQTTFEHHAGRATGRLRAALRARARREAGGSGGGPRR
jgi:hypothetical protein